MNSITLPMINRMVNNRIILCSTLLVRSKRKFSSNKQVEGKEDADFQNKNTLKKFWKQVSIRSNSGILNLVNKFINLIILYYL